MHFDDSGLFWVPEIYKKAERVKATDPGPRVLPPVPATGWEPREDFPDLSAATVIAFDTETFDPDLREKGPGVRRGAHVVGVSVAVEGFARYYPIAHSMGGNLDRTKVLAWLREQLGRAAQPKIGANLLYDLDFLSAEGVEVKGDLYDVQYADPLLYEYHASYSLEAIAQRLLNEHKETSLLYQWCADAYGGEPDGKQRGNIWRAPVELVGPYAEADALLPLRIFREQWKQLRSKGLLDVLRMECRLIPLLLKLRQRGVTLDLQRVQEVDDELSGHIDLLAKDVGINVYAAEEIAALCKKESIDFPLTEKTQKPSFTKEWLKDHAHPALRKVSELRKMYKLRDTFVRSALLGNQINGRVHCEFNPLRSDDYGTVSGRFSSSHPNLQQIPARDKYWGPRLRSCFIPDERELVWMKNDLSQIEFRLGVHFGVGEGVEEVRRRYREDKRTDFYNVVVELTGLPRQESKSLSLGTLYGMGLPKFARMIGRSLEDARAIFMQYNERLPFMRETYHAFGREAKEVGFVRTIGGRICNLDQGFDHKALNRKLQGSCADWMKRSMLRAYQAGLFDELNLYLTVHDELDTGVPRTAAGLEAARELHQTMTHAYALNIPVLAGTDLGPNWGTLTEFDMEELSLERLQGL